MSSYLYRLGRSSAAHPWRVISAWVLLIATAAALATSFGAPMRDDLRPPGTRRLVTGASGTMRPAWPARPV